MEKIRLWILAALMACALILSGCPGSSGDSGTGPIADAGPDQNVLVGWNVTLDASGSTGLASTCTWTFTSTPAGSTATLSNLVATNPTFTADKAGSYMLALTIGNGTVTSSPDTITITAVSPRPIPDTGQTTSYAAGDDGDYVTTAPTYSDHGDGTITDVITGLMWQKCTAGLSGLSCSGTATSYNWYQATGTADATYNPGGAINACGGNVVGHADWRLPTDFELMSIVDYGTLATRATNTTYFPNTQTDYYWASTPWISSSTTAAWGVDFHEGGGMLATGPKASVSPWGMVRCVRGERSAPVFEDNNDGTITDHVTNLMWQKQDNGLTENWEGALSYCEGLTSYGHDDWRVPDVKELRSIVDTTNYSPSVNATYFPRTKTTYYWSSTSVVSNPGNLAWTVSFESGSVGNTVYKTSRNYVRCVRSVPYAPSPAFPLP